MAYRTYINGHEWLGNNVLHEEIYDELKRQGCPFDQDGCVENFEVTDLDGLVKACEKVIIRKTQEDKRVADFNHTIEECVKINEQGPSAAFDLTETLHKVQSCGYIFISAQLLNYIGEFFKQWEWVIYFPEGAKNKASELKYRLCGNGKCLFSAY